MLHGRVIPHLPAADPVAYRIAGLSAELIEVAPERREAIYAEMNALMNGSVVPMTRLSCVWAPAGGGR